MRYKTAKKYYSLLIRWYDFCLDMQTWMWEHRQNKFIWYLSDLIQCHSSGFRSSAIYYDIKPKYEKMLKFIFNLLGCQTGLKIIRNIANDWDTKLIESSPRYCYTRNVGWVNRYYTCKLYPFNYMKLTRSTFDTSTKQSINTYTTAIFSTLENKTPEELKETVITLYKGFAWNKKQIVKLYKEYKKDLVEINEIMKKEREMEAVGEA